MKHKMWLCLKTLSMLNEPSRIVFVKGKKYRQHTRRSSLTFTDERGDTHECGGEWKQHFRSPLSDILKQL